MATHKVRPDLGSAEGQEGNPRRARRRRMLDALAVVAGICLVAAIGVQAVIVASGSGEPNTAAEPAETGVQNREPQPLAEPALIGTVTRSGGGCVLEIDAEPIRSGPGRLTFVNETDHNASFDLLWFDSEATRRRLEATITANPETTWTYLGLWGGPPPGVAVVRQTAVEPGASGTLIDNFTTGGYAVACVHRVGDGGHHPFALVGPILVP